MSPALEIERRPIARLRLVKRAASVPAPGRVPVFHVFEELYARAALRERAGEGSSPSPA